jgi:hypothetical protein
MLRVLDAFYLNTGLFADGMQHLGLHCHIRAQARGLLLISPIRGSIISLDNAIQRAAEIFQLLSPGVLFVVPA